MAEKYTYLTTDFLNDSCFAGGLGEEINASSITTTLSYINTNPDGCDIYFESALTGEEITTLDGLVAAHDGVEPIVDAGLIMGSDGLGSMDWDNITIISGAVHYLDMMEWVENIFGDITTLSGVVDAGFTTLSGAIEVAAAGITTFSGAVQTSLDGIYETIITTSGALSNDMSTHVGLPNAHHNQLHVITSTADHSANNWQLFYSDGSGDIKELAFGTSGDSLISSGPSAAPYWATISGGAGGSGDVTSALGITDNAIVRGDGGAKGIQDSLWSIDDNGKMSISTSKTGYILDIRNTASTGGAGLRLRAGEELGDIVFKIVDADESFSLMEIEAHEGYIVLGQTYADTLSARGTVYGVDNQHDDTAGGEEDFNTQIGTYRIAGANVVMPTGGTAGQVLAKVDSTSYNTEWVAAGGGGGVFGSEYSAEVSEGESSTTSTSWQGKIDFDVISVPAGTYMLHWYSEIRMSSTSYSVKARVEMDASSDPPYIGYMEIEPQDSDNWYVFSGHKVLSLDGTHDIDLEYCTTNYNGTAYIRKGRFTLWRIS